MLFNPGHFCTALRGFGSGLFFTAFATESFNGFWVLSLFYTITNTQGTALVHISASDGDGTTTRTILHSFNQEGESGKWIDLGAIRKDTVST